MCTCSVFLHIRPTLILQPLDVGVFGPVKNAWRSVLKEHQIATCASTVTIKTGVSITASKRVRLIVPSFQHFTSGFRRTGLCPLSKDAIPTSRLRKALPFSRPATESQPQQNEPSASQADQEVAVELVGTWNRGKRKIEARPVVVMTENEDKKENERN